MSSIDIRGELDFGDFTTSSPLMAEGNNRQ